MSASVAAYDSYMLFTYDCFSFLKNHKIVRHIVHLILNVSQFDGVIRSIQRLENHN